MKYGRLNKAGLAVAGFLLFFAIHTVASACDINFDVIKGSKKKYEPGDVIITKVTVLLTHRNCPVALDETKFKYKGLKVLGATKWRAASSTTYERRLKIKILGNEEEKDKVYISATRTCDKEGGFGSLKLEVKDS